MVSLRRSLHSPAGLTLTLALMLPAFAAPPPRPVAPTGPGDRYGDPLPAAAIARLGTLRWRQSSGVGSVALSPDGKRIASVGAWNVSVWDTQTGRELLRLKDQWSERIVSFSPDGRTLLATDSQGSIRHWDVETEKLL